MLACFLLSSNKSGKYAIIFGQFSFASKLLSVTDFTADLNCCLQILSKHISQTSVKPRGKSIAVVWASRLSAHCTLLAHSLFWSLLPLFVCDFFVVIVVGTREFQFPFAFPYRWLVKSKTIAFPFENVHWFKCILRLISLSHLFSSFYCYSKMHGKRRKQAQMSE